MKMIPVVVSTDRKGVFFGYVPEGTNLDRTSIRIENARMVTYWSADTQGFVGLAARGPASGSKIGPACPAITLQMVVSVMEASQEAAKCWEERGWNN